MNEFLPKKARKYCRTACKNQRHGPVLSSGTMTVLLCAMSNSDKKAQRHRATAVCQLPPINDITCSNVKAAETGESLSLSNYAQSTPHTNSMSRCGHVPD